MQKRIFEQDDLQNNPTSEFVSKQEFDTESVQIDEDIIDSESLQNEILNKKFTEIVQPKATWWKKILMGTTILFLTATVAQSIQWIINSWQQNQWLSLAFSIVAFSILFLGITMIFKEMRLLISLKKRMILQDKSEAIHLKSAVDFKDDFQTSFEYGKALCLDVVKTMKISTSSSELQQWQGLINESYSAQEVTQLFSQTVLSPVDQQAKKLVSKNSVECALIIAVSPLAIVDMFFLAWRNIRLINQLAKLYGIELGYVSRMRLLRMVFINMAFAGVTEVLQDIGMDWLSQDISAKLSARVAQGVGVGLLTARLGIKAMEFCRPISYNKNERPRLSHIQKELLTTLKSVVLNTTQHQEKIK